MSNEEEEVTPSRTNTNKMIRVLTGKHQKFTVTVHLADGNKIEWQSDQHPRTKWNDEDRSLWLFAGDYGSGPIMRFPDGAIVLCEENPDYVEKKK
jgi:hypothetical protein